MSLFGNFYAGKRVLVTGHTGFKGGWLALWLRELGAEVIGYSLSPPSTPSFFETCKLATLVHDIRADILDYEQLLAAFQTHRPEIVFHLAAQPLVRAAYVDPRLTFHVNVMGTVNVLEAARRTNSVQMLIAATSDKVYRNTESGQAFREADPLGGYEPYGVSKACAELVIGAYQDHRFQEAAQAARKLAIASVRAGNVIGGGDWAAYRIVPDIVRALATSSELVVRNPDAIRPWQHVLDALSGYLCLGPKLVENPARFASAWNFGPDEETSFTVRALVDRFLEHWSGNRTRMRFEASAAGEHQNLRVDAAKARQELGWQSVWDIDQTLSATVDWYRTFHQSPDNILSKSSEQIRDYSGK